MTVQYTAHVKLSNGKIQTYESGADSKQVAVEAALGYFDAVSESVSTVVGVSRGPYR